MGAPASRRLVLSGLAFAAAAAVAGPAIARPFDDVKSSGVLRVALYRDNAPFSDDPGGKPVGIDVDLARMIAEKLGLKAEIRIVEASENVDGDFRLNLWRGDLAGSTLADLMLNVPADKLLALRNEQVFFTPPYVEQRLAIAYREGVVEGGFQDVQDIEGKTVAVEGTSPVDALLGFANGGVYREALKHYRDFSEAAAAYLAGETDFLAGSRVAIEAALAAAAKEKRAGIEVKDIVAAGVVKTRWELCGAVRSDSRDLAYQVGDAIAALTAEGAVKAAFAAHGATFNPPAGY